MPARNGDHGYGWVSKLLHWLTVAALAAQFALGLSMRADAAAERAEEAAEAREEAAEELGEQAEEAAEQAADRAADQEYLIGLGDGLDPLDLHVGVGIGLVLLGILRLAWRRIGGLPPWAPGLSHRERVLATWTERVLLGSLFLVPATGISLILTQDDGLVGWHVAAQLLLLAALAVHLTNVVRHTLIRRERLLSRMLPSR